MGRKRHRPTRCTRISPVHKTLPPGICRNHPAYPLSDPDPIPYARILTTFTLMTTELSEKSEQI